MLIYAYVFNIFINYNKVMFIIKKQYRLLTIVILIIIVILFVVYYLMNDKFTIKDEKKIAFLFLTRDNLHSYDIWETFFLGNENKYSMYCHPKNKDLVTDKLLKNNIITENIETCWGCSNLVKANIYLLKNALKDLSNHKFILVSESCIPIVSFTTMYNELTKDNLSRIGIHNKNSSLDRYNLIDNPIFDINKFVKHSASGCVFNRNHAQILVDTIDHVDNWKKLQAPDEHYNGSMLLHLDIDFNNNNQSNIKTTFDIWQKDDLKKDTYDDNDIIIDNYILLKKITNKGIDAIRNSGFMLIRKVNKNTEIDKNYLLQV